MVMVFIFQFFSTLYSFFILNVKKIVLRVIRLSYTLASRLQCECFLCDKHRRIDSTKSVVFFLLHTLTERFHREIFFCYIYRTR